MANGNYTGAGTSTNPYIVEDLADFMAVIALEGSSKHIKLAGDIDFSSLGTLTGNLATGSIASLNGMNHTVKNLTINAPSSQVGFIAHTGNCSVQNLVVENFNFTCQSGGFLKYGSNNSGSYPNVSFKNVHIKNSRILATSTSGFFVDFCYSRSSGGGIVFCSVENCDLIAGGNAGFIGYGGYGLIRDSYARNCRIRAGSHIGFIGYKNWTGRPLIQNCYMHGEFYFTTDDFHRLYLGGDNGGPTSYNSDIRSCAIIPTKVAVSSELNVDDRNIIILFGEHDVYNCFYVPVPIVVGELNG